MTEQEFVRQRQKLNELMVREHYHDADVLCQSMWRRLHDAQEGMKPTREMFINLAQINAALVVETCTRDRVQHAIDRLQEAGECAYSIFLQARLLWLDKKLFAAMELMESYFQAGVRDNHIVFAAGSPYHSLDVDTKERVLNLFGQIYKVFCLPEAGANCNLEASQVVEDFPTKLLEYSNFLFDTHYIFMPPEEYLKVHLGFGQLFADKKEFKQSRLFKHKKFVHRRHQKLRIGYLSPDLRHHVVLLFIWAMLTQYDRERFEVYCFSRSPVEDKYSGYIKEQVDGWCNVSGMDARQGAKAVYDREIDILVELAGHSSNNGMHIMAYKPAPVQVCGIGYFATTGLKTVDYYLSDSYLFGNDTACDGVQLAESEWFTEKLLVLPHSHFCYVPLQDMPEPQGAPCKKNGYVTFGSFNNLTKANDTVLQVWAELLRQVPDSRLFLKGSLFDEPEGRNMFAMKLSALGISDERFELRGFSMPYLTEYYEMDIALDTFPYPGGGTTCDALYMGVPVVTLGDGSHGGNFGISLLKNIGLDFCCAFGWEEYVEKAAMLAADFELLDALHLGLRSMMEDSPVMNKTLYMQELEQGYEKIWQNYMEQQG